MGCCLKKPNKDSRPELFKHTSLIDDDDNYYIDQNERLRTLIEIEEIEDGINQEKSND